ncbi:MAG: GlsB/YeaQ/YmgE family stress response membrane protein [Ardenticatenales bacterium]|nr:GlsB/YeaQ/YmgE family stress response membrane protein [Ardenticatenales bacterium]
MNVMWILAWVVVGAIGGWLAGYVTTKNMKFDWVDVVLGMVGAVVGGWLLSFFGIESAGLSIGSILAAFVGAVLITWLYGKFMKKQIQ